MSTDQKDSDPRKAYWNDKYLAYWKTRVDEAGKGKSKVISGDSNTEDDSVYQKIFAQHGFNAGTLLEVGCAWGRMFPTYLLHGLVVTGSDISQAMVDAARRDWIGQPGVLDVIETAAETLPFPDQHFDNLSCLATLDATFQHQAMAEFLRVTKPGARIYVTGKNELYFADDKEAYLAEVGARGKSHPNFFTDTSRLMQLLEQQGHKVESVYCFPRRGDFAAFRHVPHLQDRFYEYLLVITRGEQYWALPEFSSAYSRTYRDLSGNHE